jgi:hypothetical protein
MDGTELGEAGSPLRISPWTRLWRTALTLIGGAGGFAIAWSNPDRGIADGWYAWATLGTLLGLVAGSTFGSGVARRRDVNDVQPVRAILILPSMIFFVLIALGVLPLAVLVIGTSVTWRGLAFAGLAIVGAVPCGAAMAAIRSLALRGLPGSPGSQLAGLIRLRRLLGRLLAMFGSLVLLVTMVNAAGLNWGSSVPRSAVVFSGGAAAALVGIVYIPTAALLRRRGAVFVDEHFSLAAVGRAELVAAADQRARLEAILALDRSTLGELQAGLLIISPLLASAGVALLPF